MTSEAGVCVFSEDPGVVLELLSIGRKLAGQMDRSLTSISLGSGARSAAGEHIARGARRVFVIDGPHREHLSADLCLEALREVVELLEPEILLIGATVRGAEVAARLAQRLRVACASECLDLDTGAGAVCVTRRCLGRFLTRQLIRTRPAVATIQPRRFAAPAPDPSLEGILQELRIEAPEPPTRLLRSMERRTSGVRMEDASAIVAIGRGLQRKEDLAIVEQLARILDGLIGATRPLTDDLQWLPVDLKIGLSGCSVKPDLYLACGISGEIEHVVGMRESGVVVAINKDPNAPIMEEADYRVVGDLYQVIPALTRVLEELLPALDRRGWAEKSKTQVSTSRGANPRRSAGRR